MATYIFGHTTPDTDSIVGAISLSYLKNKIGEDTIPTRQGEPSPETAWILDKFGFEAPTDMWIESHKKTMIHEIKKSLVLENVMDIRDDIFKNKSMLWKMYNVAIWENVYEVKIEK